MGNKAIAIWLWGHLLGYLSWDGPKYLNGHSLPIGIKTDSITEEDLLLFAKENDIASAKQIVIEVRQVVSQWSEFAKEAEVPQKWIQRISRALQQPIYETLHRHH